MSRTLVNPNNTPRELWAYKQFACWQYVDNGRPKLSKVPLNPRTLRNAGSTYPNTWSDICTAVAAYRTHSQLDGISFALTKHDPYIMIDIDGCIVARQFSELAINVMHELNTYTEKSPSKCGLRLFVHCGKQPDSIKRPDIEIYSHSRFATLTGDIVNDRPIAKLDDLDEFINQFIPKVEPKMSPSYNRRYDPPSSDDGELWQRIFKKNSLAQQLYNGDLSNVRDNGDLSRAVILLLNTLALWTKSDASRMDRMMRQTQLDQTKWDERRRNQTWLDGRIYDAINYMAARGAR
ncbi:hypothetical protein BH10CHL1_BH10CHL1_47780 [soil metagenome]